MKIHLVKKQTIENFAAVNARSRVPFEDWLAKLKFANWEKPTDINATFRSADMLGKGCERVVFDIGGNNYRMIAKYFFGAKQVHLFVCWLGTHKAYDELCNSNKQYTVINK